MRLKSCLNVSLTGRFTPMLLGFGQDTGRNVHFLRSGGMRRATERRNRASDVLVVEVKEADFNQRTCCKCTKILPPFLRRVGPHLVL